MTEAALFELNNVSKVFGGKLEDIVVLRNVSFRVVEGDFAIIFGPSGCGKSTLIHIIEGLEEPTLGEVLFDKENIYNLSEDERAAFRKENVGIVPQQATWIRSLNVLENVAFPLQLQGFDIENSLEKAREILKHVGMIDWQEYDPAELSSGQQQRVALARALVTDPKIIIADEPTGNLDYASGQEYMRMVQQLNSNGKTIIMVTHDLANLAYAKHIVQMLDGKIVKVFDKTESGVDLLKDALVLPPGMDMLNQAGTASSINNYTHKITQEKAEEHLDIKKILRNIFAPLKNSKQYLYGTLQNIQFALLVIWFLIIKIIKNVTPKQIWRTNLHSKPQQAGKSGNIIKTFELFNISYKNLFIKRTRTVVTIGGMVIAIGGIVVLLSLGYGVEKIVVARVSALNETHQITVGPVPGTNVKINEASIAKMRGVKGVEKVLPAVGLVGRVKYDNSTADIAVYAVDPEYLEQSAIKPILGSIYPKQPTLSGSITGGQKQDTELAASPTPSVAEEVDKDLQSLLENDTESTKNIEVNAIEAGDIIVNKAFLRLIGLTYENAMNKILQISFAVTGDLVDNKLRIESNQLEYKITGVYADNQTPYVYIDTNILAPLGIQNYSEAKVLINQRANLFNTRKQIESEGFKTTSIVDTISQIESLFNTVRLFLTFIGLIALTIASLGIFNTLTVSLLERTKEVGLMKMMGMDSLSVKKLFISESLILSLNGGILGLLVGFLIGKLISLILTMLALDNKGAFLDVSYIPLGLVLLVVLLSITVGILTGIFPARRATTISALEAIRNE